MRKNLAKINLVHAESDEKVKGWELLASGFRHHASGSVRDAETSERRVVVTLMKTLASEHEVLIISKTVDLLT